MNIPDGVESQVMSPSTQTALFAGTMLEGETAGPLYGSAEQGVSVSAVNGSGNVVFSASDGAEPSSVFVAPAVDGASAYTTDSVRAPITTQPTTTQLQQQAASAAAYAENTVLPPFNTPAVATEHVAHQVTVEGVTFSPPEELPRFDGSTGTSSSAPNVWFMRLGEFLQRRVSQAGASLVTPLIEARTAARATPPSRTPLSPPRSWQDGAGRQGLMTPEAESAMQQWERRWRRQGPLLNPSPQQPSDSSTGSITREQVLNEVQKQVAIEMQEFHRQREALEAENVKLKALVEQFVHSTQPRLQDQVGQLYRGNHVEPQGSAPLLQQQEARVGLPPGLDQASGLRPDEDPLRQPSEGRRLGDGFEVQGGSGRLLGSPPSLREGPGVFGGNLAGQYGGRSHEGSNPLGVPEGRDSGFRAGTSEPPVDVGRSEAPRAPSGVLDPLYCWFEG